MRVGGGWEAFMHGLPGVRVATSCLLIRDLCEREVHFRVSVLMIFRIVKASPWMEFPYRLRKHTAFVLFRISFN